MKIEELKRKVLENLYNENIRNYRDIDVKNGDLIVLGFVHPNNSYIAMGQYQFGDMHNFVNIVNGVEIETKDTFGEKINPFNKEKELDIETAQFWRIATDTESELYYNLYPHFDVINSIDKFLEESKYCDIDEEDLINLLNYIKCYLNKQMCD
jgi:hypothetical protein